MLLGVSVGLLGCQGIIDEPNWMPPDDEFYEAEVDFECPADRAPVDAPLRRLSRTQLENTVRDTLTALLGEGESGVVMNEINRELGAIPGDLRTTDSDQQEGQLAFYRADQSVGGSAVDAHYGLSLQLGEALTTPSRLDALGSGCLMVGNSDGACIDGFIRRVGDLTHRRPMQEDEFRFYRDEVYTAGDLITLEDLRDVVTVLFAQPNFLFHVEGTGTLTAHEAANRLSYHLWDTMPDDALRASAASGDLLTSEGWQAEVTRVLADPRSEQAFRSFLTEWLRFDHLNTASTGTGADFEAIAGDLDLDAEFDRAVEDELVDLFAHVVRTGGTFEDFFLSEVTPTSHPILAEFYGVSPAAPGEVVAVPPERRGILTRVGLLLSRAEVALPTINSITHPILRGVFVRRQITCDNLQAAPGGAMDDLPVVDRSVVGSRDATNRLTGSIDCSGCHGRINPTGFAFEGFDAIGRARTMEPLFNAAGEQTALLPIDASAQVFESEDPITGPVELGQVLFDSEKPGACFTRHYVRFALGRTERLEEDGCLLRDMDEAIDDGRPLREVLSMVILNPDFRVRAEN